jgi:hypothetical protein
MTRIVPNYSVFRKRNPSKPGKPVLRLFELALVLVRLDHVAEFVEHANDYWV